MAVSFRRSSPSRSSRSRRSAITASLPVSISRKSSISRCNVACKAGVSDRNKSGLSLLESASMKLCRVNRVRAVIVLRCRARTGFDRTGNGASSSRFRGLAYGVRHGVFQIVKCDWQQGGTQAAYTLRVIWLGLVRSRSNPRGGSTPSISDSTGQTIAAVGNNGATTGPHLHFQLMDNTRFALAEGVPYELDSFVLVGHVNQKTTCST